MEACNEMNELDFYDEIQEILAKEEDEINRYEETDEILDDIYFDHYINYDHDGNYDGDDDDHHDDYLELHKLTTHPTKETKKSVDYDDYADYPELHELTNQPIEETKKSVDYDDYLELHELTTQQTEETMKSVDYGDCDDYADHPELHELINQPTEETKKSIDYDDYLELHERCTQPTEETKKSDDYDDCDDYDDYPELHELTNQPIEEIKKSVDYDVYLELHELTIQPTEETEKSVDYDDCYDYDDYADYPELHELTNQPIEGTKKSVELPENIPKLYIGNILDSKTVNISDDETCLQFMNLKFINAKIRGIVVDVRLDYDKALLIVDDNTDIIPCIVESNTPLDLIKQQYLQQTEEENEETNENDSVNELLQVCKIMHNEIMERLKSIPNYLSFEIGDRVEVTGNFQDVCGERTCFVTNIRKVSCSLRDSNDFHIAVRDLHEALANIDDDFYLKGT